MNAQTVTINGNAYQWTPENGIDLAVIHETKFMLKNLASKYARIGLYYACDNDDLIQTGYIGVIRAARWFEPRGGNDSTDFTGLAWKCIIFEIRKLFYRIKREVSTEYEHLLLDETTEQRMIDSLTIDAFFPRLKKGQQEAIIHCFGLYGEYPKSEPEAALVLGLKCPSTVSVHKNRAIRAFRAWLGVDDSAIPKGIKRIHCGTTNTQNIIKKRKRNRNKKVA